MHARAQKLAATFPGKENGEAHKAAMKTTPAFTPPLHPSAPEVTMLDGIAVTAHVSRDKSGVFFASRFTIHYGTLKESLSLPRGTL